MTSLKARASETEAWKVVPEKQAGPAGRKLVIPGNCREMKEDEIIVSKTNLKGHVTYANDVFLHIADYEANEVFGKPHSIVRNEPMPRAIFKLLWDTISAGKEIFAYVVNRTKFGDHYWVFAHVTPSFKNGEIVGYHSNRRKPDARAIEKIAPLYADLLAEEAAHKNAKDGLKASFALLQQKLEETGMDYDRFVLSL